MVTVATAAQAPTAALATPEITPTATPAELTIGAQATVAGHLADAGVGVGEAAVALQSEGYPFRGFVTVARAVTRPTAASSSPRCDPTATRGCGYCSKASQPQLATRWE